MCDCTLKKIHAQDLVHYYQQRLFLCRLKSDGTDFYMIDHFCYHSGPTVPVRGLNGTATVVVQDKYARMLVLQGHCPLVNSVFYMLN